MYKQLHNTLATIDRDLQIALLAGNHVGIEKEALRVDINGSLSQLAHPNSLGSALTNSYITTDYSEALLELITPPIDGVKNARDYLYKIHQFVYAHLGEEYMWGASMPCVVGGEEGIPIADYGSSNLGMMKTVYRRGLGYRYGKMMQVIAGVHFNYSLQDEFWPYYQKLLANQDQTLQDFISEQYFAMIRNLQRYGWLIFYLFGTSPAICKSFLSGQPGTLEQFDSKTYYLPYATSLRMGDIGYTNKKENETGVQACYDNLPSYINCLTKAIETPCPEYEKIGVKVNGEYRQLNANILQIENEYYSTIRPKQPLVKNEKPVHALAQRGVQYIELRSLDLNLFDPLGISESQLYFLETYMLFCLLQNSPLINKHERDAVEENESNVAHRGRDPELKLAQVNKSISLQDWGRELLTEMLPVAGILDKQNKGEQYSTALEQQLEVINDAELTPSAKVLSEMRENNECFFEYARRLSKQHEKQLRNSELSDKDLNFFQEHVRQSVEKQGQYEASDTQTFDQFLHNYFTNTVSEQDVTV
ncbi:MAG: glutamate--cysteine ligase [Pseudomonadota bacterium]